VHTQPKLLGINVLGTPLYDRQELMARWEILTCWHYDHGNSNYGVYIDAWMDPDDAYPQLGNQVYGNSPENWAGYLYDPYFSNI